MNEHAQQYNPFNVTPINRSKEEPRRGITGSELLRTVYPETPMIVPDMLPAVGLLLFAGKQKSGKSWLALQLAIAKAIGGEFLGHKLTAGKVLYLGLEDNEKRLQKRILTLHPELNPDLLDNITFFTVKDGIPRLGKGLEEIMIPYLSDHELTVIDILQKIRTVGGNNGYSDDYADMERLQSMAMQYETSIFSIHHARKAEAVDPMDAILGTGGIGGCADNIWILNRKKGNQDATLFITGRETQETTIKLLFDSGTWTHNGVMEDEPQCKPLPKIQQAALDVLLNHPDRKMLRQEWIDATSHISAKSGNRSIARKALIKNGLVKHERDTDYVTLP